ncbi:MAG TPA: hypothetical protein VGC42_05835 [Kofleriaceae bacterium]
MNKIAERAGALGLFSTAKALADAKIDPDIAPRDPRLTEAPGDDSKRLLGQMARRGADPALVAALWARLAGRPLERALVAVDVLGQAVWGPRDPLLTELRAAMSALGPARPLAGEVGVDLDAHPATALIERLARQAPLAGASTIELMARALDMDLGALDELRRRGDELVGKQATRDSVYAFGRLASLARLPTLASVYFDWLMRGLDWRVPAGELCEALFDAEVAQKIPGDAVREADVPQAEQRDVAEYCLYRAHLGVGDSDTANALLVQNMTQRPRWMRGPSLRLDVVRAHLGLLYGRDDVALDRVEAACAQDGLWRYGAKVRAMVAAKTAPGKALELFHGYLAGFGNDFETGITAISLAPEAVKRDLARVLCREAYYLPHEPAPWKLLGLLFGVGAPITEEIDARIRRQSV